MLLLLWNKSLSISGIYLFPLQSLTFVKKNKILNIVEGFDLTLRNIIDLYHAVEPSKAVKPPIIKKNNIKVC